MIQKTQENTDRSYRELVKNKPLLLFKFTPTPASIFDGYLAFSLCESGRIATN